MDEVYSIVTTTESVLGELNQRINIHSDILPNQYRLLLDDSLNKLRKIKVEASRAVKSLGTDTEFDKIVFGCCELLQISKKQLDKTERYLQKQSPYENSDTNCHATYGTPNACDEVESGDVEECSSNTMTTVSTIDGSVTEVESVVTEEVRSCDEEVDNGRRMPRPEDFGITPAMLNRLSRFTMVDVGAAPQSAGRSNHKQLPASFASASSLTQPNITRADNNGLAERRAEADRTYRLCDVDKNVGRAPLQSCDNTQYIGASSLPAMPVLSSLALQSLNSVNKYSHR